MRAGLRALVLLAFAGAAAAPAARAQGASAGSAAAGTAAMAAPEKSAASAPEGEPVPAGNRGGEAAVQRTLIDEKTARIEELRVRGELQRATVDPKGGMPVYEIIVPTGARDLSDGAASNRGAAGKRVWSVFRF